ncbi:MAG: DUF3551 domain-containing protein [Rhizobiales bacterium]|nr:DUF3551 domain-containing protein [Hyphomicrobiales bacterium]
MLTRFAIAAAFAAAFFGAGVPSASAREHPWCSVTRMYGGDGPRICVFDSLEECRQETLGSGDWCNPNPYYRPVEAERRHPIRRPTR